MLCPVCKDTVLEDSLLELGLRGHSCSRCEGSWIRSGEYEEWKNGNAGPGAPSKGLADCQESGNSKAVFCPDCGRLLLKYKVSADLPFYVDWCGACGGLWLDKSEWECIIARGLQCNVNEFSSSEWQDKVRADVSMKHFEDIYLRKFGQEDYSRLREIREWIHGSKLKGEMISFLIDEDPYKP